MQSNLKIGADEITKYPHISGIAPQTAKLIDRFKDWKPGDVASDTELSALIGRDTSPGGDGYGNLASAIRYVQRHYGLVIERVRSARAVKCLNAGETISSVNRGRRHIGKCARKEGGKLKQVDVSKLEGPEKTEALVLRAQLGAVATYASASTQKKLSTSEDLESWRKQQKKMLAAM